MSSLSSYKYFIKLFIVFHIQGLHNIAGFILRYFLILVMNGLLFKSMHSHCCHCINTIYTAFDIYVLIISPVTFINSYFSNFNIFTCEICISLGFYEVKMKKTNTSYTALYLSSNKSQVSLPILCSETCPLLGAQWI